MKFQNLLVDIRFILQRWILGPGLHALQNRGEDQVQQEIKDQNKNRNNRKFNQ